MKMKHLWVLFLLVLAYSSIAQENTILTPYKFYVVSLSLEQLEYASNSNKKLPPQWLDNYVLKGDTLDILKAQLGNGSYMIYQEIGHKLSTSIYCKNSYNLSYYNIDKDFYLSIRDSLGRLVNNARIKSLNSKNKVEIANGIYKISKVKKNHSLRVLVDVNGEIGLHNLGYMGDIPFFKIKNGKQKYASMAMLSQSQYRHGDTIRASIVVWKGKKTVTKPLEVIIEQGSYYYNEKPLHSKMVESQEGVYIFEFVIPDTFLLDKRYQLSYISGNQREYLSFLVKDYELDKTNVEFSIKDRQKDSVLLHISVTDNNGFARVGSEVSIIAKPHFTMIDSQYLHINDTLWYKKVTIDNNKPLKVVFLDTFKHQAEGSILFKVKINTPNGEVFNESESLSLQKDKELFMELDSVLRVHYKDHDRRGTATLEYFIGDVPFNEKIELPYRSKVSTERRYTSVYTKEATTFLEKPRPILGGVFVMDKVLKFYLDIYSEQEVDYQLYKDEKIVKRGKYTDTIQIEHFPKSGYWLRYHFMLNGTVVSKMIYYTPTENKIEFKVNHKKTAQPGDEIEIEFEVKDASGKPIKNAIIMGSSVSSQMDGRQSTIVPQRAINYRLQIQDGPNEVITPNIRSNISKRDVSHNTINLEQYCNIFYPVDDVYFTYIPLDSQYHSNLDDIKYGQVWASITDKDGKSLRIYQVKVDGLLKYELSYSSAKSMLLPVGKHDIELRTYNKTYFLKDVEIQQDYKVVISFNIDGVVPENRKLRKKLTKWEKKDATQNLVVFQNNSKHNALIQHLGGFSKSIRSHNRYSNRPSFITMGPVIAGTQIDIKLSNGKSFSIKTNPYHQYTITDNEILMTPLSVKNMTKKLEKYGNNSGTLSGFYPYKELSERPIKSTRVIAYSPDKSSGDLKTNLFVFTSNYKYYHHIVFENTKTGDTFMRSSSSGYKVPPSIYNLYFQHRDSFQMMSNVLIPKTGRTYLRIDMTELLPLVDTQKVFNKFSTELLFKKQIKGKTGVVLQLKTKLGYPVSWASVFVKEIGKKNTLYTVNNLGLVFIPMKETKSLNCLVVFECRDTSKFIINYEKEMGFLWKSIVLKCEKDENYQTALSLSSIEVELKYTNKEFFRKRYSRYRYTASSRWENNNWTDADRFYIERGINFLASENNSVYGTSFLGSRTDATAYYVDGVSVLNSSLINLPVRSLNSIASISYQYSSRKSRPLSYDDASDFNAFRGTLNRYDSDGVSDFYDELYDYSFYDMDEEEPGGFFDYTESKPKLKIRENFSDLGFWIPYVKTDENGKATFKTHLPDDIATWESRFIITDIKRRSDSKTTSLKSYKSVMAQLHTPRFLVAGDSTVIQGELNNTLLDSIKLYSSFKLNNTQLEADTSRIGSNHFVKQGFQLDSNYSEEELEIEFSTTDQKIYTDGERRSIPVFPKGILVKKGSLYEIEPNSEREFDMDTGDSNYLIMVTSPRDLLLHQLNTVIDYEYNCNEQIASKLRAALILIKDKKNTKADVKRYDKLIKSYFSTLSKNQINGYWGWWPNSRANIWMTCYIAEALNEAQKSGYDVSSTLKITYGYLISEYDAAKKGVRADNIIRCLLKIGFDVPKEDLYIALKNSKRIEDQITVAQLGYDLQIHSSFKKLDSLKRTDILGNTFWGVDTFGFGSQSLKNTCEAYSLLKKHNPELANKTRKYLWNKVYANQSLNTYEKVWIAEALYSDEDTINEVKKCLLLTNTKSIGLTNHEKTKVVEDNITLKNPNSSVAYAIFLTEKWNTNPMTADSIFSVTTDYHEAVKKGEPIEVTITLSSDKELGYVQLQVPIPAGCSYYGSQSILNATHTEFYKNKVVIYAEQVKKGESTFTFKLLPKYAGEYIINATTAELMYFPIYNGNNTNKKIEIK
ncbi:MAG: hypothetical protein COA58_07355 [Bacteroidetes bacterium]|nr:MAG: hypothetical protein COA58_07355 [Bacteroidota bacterium]